MPERASVRLWVSIVAAVIILPGAVMLLLAAWVIHLQIGLPMLTDRSAATLAASPAISPVQQKVEAAMPPQPVTGTEPVALPPQAPEPSSTMTTPGEASPAVADRAQDAVAPMPAGQPAALEPSEPITGAVAPMPAQVAAAVPPPPATAAEPVAPAPDDAKAPGFASASSLFATLALVPPILGRASPAYTDPTPDTFASISAVMTARPATPELAEPFAEPVPLPKPKPHVTVVHVGRAVPFSRPRPELIR